MEYKDRKSIQQSNEPELYDLYCEFVARNEELLLAKARSEVSRKYLASHNLDLTRCQFNKRLKSMPASDYQEICRQLHAGYDLSRIIHGEEDLRWLLSHLKGSILERVYRSVQRNEIGDDIHDHKTDQGI